MTHMCAKGPQRVKRFLSVILFALFNNTKPTNESKRINALQSKN